MQPDKAPRSVRYQGQGRGRRAERLGAVLPGARGAGAEAVAARSALADRGRGAANRSLVAVDLGFGDGADTVELLRRGWTVCAIDSSADAVARLQEAVAEGHRDRLTIERASFTDATLPTADLVFAGLSLPFCEPTEFAQVWDKVVAAIWPGGWFAGHLFGDRDGWAGEADMTFLTRDQALAFLLKGFDVQAFREQDESGRSTLGPKHWHVFHVIARRESYADSPSA